MALLSFERSLLLLIINAILLTSTTQCSRTRRVEDVQVVTADIDNFWAAYPAAMRDTALAYHVFEQQYFAKGSPGLLDYYQRRYQSNPVLFARRITKRPQYYASARHNQKTVGEQKPQILAALRRLQALYPPIRFNHIYFLIGGFSGSTAQPPGLLIGTEHVANGPDIDFSELTLVERNRSGLAADMPYIVTHEMIHNVQQRAQTNLLCYATREGMADFIAELLTGSLGTNARLHIYGNAHEQELWLAFKQDMLGSNTKNWLANSAQETPEKPCDLGYYVGYKICQAYYSKATNKQQAVRDMLTTKDFIEFLQKSGYEEKMSQF
ncbi:DUF2268 domain-containing putative Zn-dependent protease [Hymenobacter wooponensis]|uniref:Uncharacterized protein n=1 Tax=Hymenobacter wooponensis TaxID=1525360 RepID=A0A4Z0MIJ6_9BACT|nr:DUF2268 domain-containing putative Zn-dependent protease [Hymenobacter wooponensis]TGD79346.1 hypothetical protein EU557_14000 [Hymenobacter wooponensis]